MTKNETIIEWRVPLTSHDLERISKNYICKARRSGIAFLIVNAVTVPFLYRFFEVATGRPPQLQPLIMFHLIFAAFPVICFIEAIRTRYGKPQFGRTHRITERGLNPHDEHGMAWLNALYYEILKSDDESSPTVCFYRKSGRTTHARLPHEPERSTVINVIDKFVPQYDPSMHGPIELNEEPPAFIRIVSLTLAILGGVVTGLSARPILHSLRDSGIPRELAVYCLFAMPMIPVIAWHFIQRMARPKRERAHAFAWTFASCLTTFMALGCTAIAPLTIQILRGDIESPTNLPVFDHND